MSDLISFDEVLDIALKDPEFADEFNELREQRKLAAMLKEARIAKNLTQLQVAERSGINVKNISRLERGVVSPKYTTVVRYLKAVGGEFQYIPA